jgi:hypothetical protein
MALDVIALNVRRQLAGHRHTPRFVNAGIIAIGRQFINGDVKLTDIPSSPSLSKQSCSGHLAVLHHLIKCVG